MRIVWGVGMPMMKSVIPSPPIRSALVAGGPDKSHNELPKAIHPKRSVRKIPMKNGGNSEQANTIAHSKQEHSIQGPWHEENTESQDMENAVADEHFFLPDRSNSIFGQRRGLS